MFIRLAPGFSRVLGKFLNIPAATSLIVSCIMLHAAELHVLFLLYLREGGSKPASNRCDVANKHPRKRGCYSHSLSRMIACFLYEISTLLQPGDPEHHNLPP